MIGHGLNIMQGGDEGGVTEDSECQNKELDLVLDRGQLLKDFKYRRNTVRFVFEDLDPRSSVEIGLESTQESRETRASEHVGAAEAPLVPS